MAESGKLDEARRRNALRRVSAHLHRHNLVLGSVHDERRYTHRRENIADIDLSVHPVERLEHPGTGSPTEQVDVCLDLLFALHAKTKNDLPRLIAILVDPQRLVHFVLVGFAASAPRKLRCPHRPG